MHTTLLWRALRSEVRAAKVRCHGQHFFPSVEFENLVRVELVGVGPNVAQCKGIEFCGAQHLKNAWS